MYEYMICNQYDEEIFYKQCKALEKYIPNLEKGRFLIDVDSSFLQAYNLNDKELIVYNDKHPGCVWIKSEFDIDPFFK